MKNKTRRSILGSDGMTLILSALWVPSECSLGALWVLDYSLIAPWVLSDLERWRLTALAKLETNGRTDAHCDSLSSYRSQKFHNNHLCKKNQGRTKFGKCNYFISLLSEKGPAHKAAVLKLKKFKEEETFHKRLQPIFETERMSEKRKKNGVSGKLFN